jgi:F-type H+-transporting ATPase subunit delta
MARRGSTARRYAEAVFELAQRDGTPDAWQVALAAASAVLGPEEVLRIVQNPAIPLQERMRAVTSALQVETIGEIVDDLLSRRRGMEATVEVVREAATGPVRDQLLNLVRLLVERRRVELLTGISSEYDQLLDRERGIVGALVASAAPLSDDETDAIRHRVEAMTGTQVSLRTIVDPELIGGLTVRVGDRLLDASVRGRLERLRQQLLAGTRPAHG